MAPKPTEHCHDSHGYPGWAYLPGDEPILAVNLKNRQYSRIEQALESPGADPSPIAQLSGMAMSTKAPDSCPTTTST